MYTKTQHAPKQHRLMRVMMHLSIAAIMLMSVVAYLGATPAPALADGPTDLFFSEYIEGGSDNKALEIYNGTGANITLSGNYTIGRFSNGSTSATEIALTGSVDDGAVFVIANPSAVTAVTDIANQTSSSINFNGNDVVVLYNNGVIIDSIGQIGDSGNFAQNVTLRRKADVCGGDTNPNDVFDDTIEWDSFAQDTFDDLGMYTADCGGVTFSKIADPTTDVSISETVFYTITLVGTEPVLTNVVITDAIPAEFTLASAADVTVDAPDVSAITPLFVNGIVTVTGEISLTAGITVTIEGTNNADGVTVDNTAYYTTTDAAGSDSASYVAATSGADLAVEKFAPTYGPIGGTLVYTFTVKNIGAGASSPTVLTDTLPTGVEYGSDDSGLNCPACTMGATGTITWDVPALNAGVGVTVTLTTTVQSTVANATTLDNTLEISDSVGSNNTSMASTTVYPLVTIQEIQEVANPFEDVSPLDAEVVLVEGIVTAPQSDGIDDGELFVIQDGTGPWSGLPIFAGSTDYNLSRGDAVRVVGTVDEFFNLTQVDSLLGVEVLSSGNLLPAAEVLPTSGFDDDDATISEQWEGVLLQFNGPATVTNDIRFGEWYFDDGSGATRADDLSDSFTENPVVGDIYISIQGIAWYSFDNYKLVPRDDADTNVRTPVDLGAQTIAAIQGEGDVSPFEGDIVTTDGVVYADLQDSNTQMGGYFIQTTTDEDGNAATSQGLFIADSSNAVSVGDVVQVTGQVREFNKRTELFRVSNVQVIGSDNIDPTTITLPESTDGFLERYENMYVQINQDMAVSQNFFLGRYGQMTLSSGERLFNPNNLSVPGSATNLAQVEDNAERLLVLDDAFEDSALGDNPDPVPFVNADTNLPPRAGDKIISGLLGPLDQGRINSNEAAPGIDYRIQDLDGDVEYRIENPRPLQPDDVGGDLKIASFNVLNYFTTLDERGADSASELTRQEDKLITALLTIDADVYGLMEIENRPDENSVQNLVDLLNGVAGAGTYAAIADPVEPFGGDEIKVAFIYKPASVTPVGVTTTTLESPFDGLNRPPLVQAFEKDGNEFIVVVNHFKSKNCSANPTGNNLDSNGTGCWNELRTEAAQALVDFLDTDPTGTGSSDILIIGDLNAYAEEDPIRKFQEAGNNYIDMIQFFLNDEGYSFIFDGEAGSLDHVLASPSMADKITGLTEYHINTDEASYLDYDEDFNPASAYSPDQYRASDHDPAIVGLSFESNTLPNGVAAGDVTQNSAVLWTRSTGTGNITFTYSTNSDFSGGTSQVETVSDPLQPVKWSVSGLSANTTYYYKVEDSTGNTADGQFKTSAPSGDTYGLRFGASGDWRGELAPYPAVKNADERNLEFFIALGDTIYADYASPVLSKTQATTLDEFRLKHTEAYSGRHGLNAWADVRSSMGILATIDDHEVTNDFAGGADVSTDSRFTDTTGLINDSFLYENGLQAFQEYNPINDVFYSDVGDNRMNNERKLYRYNTYGNDAAVIVLDARSFRDEALANVTDLSNEIELGTFLVQSFDPSRTMLGQTQLNDLLDDLQAAHDAGITWKFVIVPEPIQNFGPLLAADRFEGYAAERTIILDYITDNQIDNVVFIAADIHGTVVNNLSYQEALGGPQIPTTAFEVTTGSTAFYEPFGPTIAQLALDFGLIDAPTFAFYEGLPVANDADDTVNDKDDFLKNLINTTITTDSLNYPAIGLQDSPIDATLLQGDYLATHTFGWTEFDIDENTQKLTVTTYGIETYSNDPATLLTDPSIVNRTPEIVSQFEVMPFSRVDVAPTSVEIDGPMMGVVGTAYDFTATVTPTNTTTPISYTWMVDNTFTVSNGITNTQSFSWTTSGQKTLMVMATNGISNPVMATTVITIESADLTITKTAPITALAGEAILYRLTVANNSSAEATNLTITDMVPMGARHIDGGMLVGNVVSWTVASLAANATVEVTFTVESPSSITNTTYGVTADGGLSATGMTDVSTAIDNTGLDIGPGQSGELEKLDSRGNRVRFTFPTGAIDGDTIFRYTEVTSPTQSLTDSLRFAKGFLFQAFRRGVEVQNFQFVAGVTITITYTDTAITEIANEDSLILYLWDGSAWVDAATTCDPDSTYVRDTDANTISVRICHLTEFALAGAADTDVYLPVIQRND